MQAFEFCTPTKIVFGKDAQEKTAKEVLLAGGKRVFIVYGGGSVKKSGLLEQIEKSLQEAGLESCSFGGAKPNPVLAHAEKGVQEALAFGADFVLAVGGGSAIDTAKAIAHGTANPQVPMWDFWTGKTAIDKYLPIGVVLTISAAGSEMSDSAVLTNEATGEKRGTASESNRPLFAVLNPELTYTLPKYQLCCGIVDIMMHTLDRYFTPTSGNELTDEIAEAVLRTTIRNGRIAFENQQDYDAMSELMWCGSVSHNGTTGLGAVRDFTTHKLGHELSARFDTAHGASLSAMWGAWAEYVYPENPARFQRYLEKVWGEQEADADLAARKAIDRTVAYFRSLSMPVSLGELESGIQPDSVIDELAKACTRNDTFVVGTFKPLNYKDVLEIYKSANK